jgi:hypothetical protein
MIKTHYFASSAQFFKLFRGDKTIHRQVMAAKLQILPQGQHTTTMIA